MRKINWLTVFKIFLVRPLSLWLVELGRKETLLLQQKKTTAVVHRSDEPELELEPTASREKRQRTEEEEEGYLEVSDVDSLYSEAENPSSTSTLEVFNKFEPRHEKTCLWGFRPAKTQTSLLRYID